MTVRTIVVLALVGVLAGVALWLPGHLRGAETPAAGRAASRSASVTGAEARLGSEAAPASTGTGAAASGSGHLESLPQPSAAASAGSGLPGLTRKSERAQPLVAEPLPVTAVRKGGLVAGYPSLLAPPKAATVTTSSVNPAAGVLQVALTARCSKPCDLLRTYRIRLGAKGFTESPSQGVENRPSAALVRGRDSVSVAVVARHGKRIEYAVMAVLHARA